MTAIASCIRRKYGCAWAVGDRRYLCSPCSSDQRCLADTMGPACRGTEVQA